MFHEVLVIFCLDYILVVEGIYTPPPKPPLLVVRPLNTHRTGYFQTKKPGGGAGIMPPPHFYLCSW